MEQRLALLMEKENREWLVVLQVGGGGGLGWFYRRSFCKSILQEMGCRGEAVFGFCRDWLKMREGENFFFSFGFPFLVIIKKEK